MLHEAQRHVATTRVDATVPWTKTHVVASYQWSDNDRWATPGNVYSTATRIAPDAWFKRLRPSTSARLSPAAWKPPPTSAICWRRGTFPVGMVR